jgi:outer membrane biosynthesis protein TonB
MTIFLDPQETAERFELYIQELRAILKANNLKFGSPENFFAFVRRLQSDDLLPADLSRMVKFIVERENSIVTLRTMLTIIAIASGGPAMAEANRDLSKPVNVVIDFLIRSGNFGPAEPEQLGDRPEKLLQSLTLLDLNVQKTDLHLDSIEQQISTIEPQLEDVSTPNTEPIRRAHSPVEPPSIPNDPPLPGFVRRASPSKEHTAWFFLLGEKLVVVPVLATIAGSTLLYIGYQRHFTKTGIRPAAPGPSATLDPTSKTPGLEIAVSPPHALIAATTGAAATPLPKPSAGSPTTDALASKAIENHSSQTPKPAERTADHAPQRSVPLANVATAEAPQTHGSTEATAKTKRDVGSTSAKSAASLRMVDVSSGVMAANLISASPPSYPKLAGLTHMQGKVIMQAIISKEGTVQNLHVIQGHRLLRGAAKSSARNWRYRPYKVNGKPVEVATIVSVDFILGHGAAHTSIP